MLNDFAKFAATLLELPKNFWPSCYAGLYSDDTKETLKAAINLRSAVKIKLG